MNHGSAVDLPKNMTAEQKVKPCVENFWPSKEIVHQMASRSLIRDSQDVGLARTQANGVTHERNSDTFSKNATASLSRSNKQETTEFVSRGNSLDGCRV